MPHNPAKLLQDVVDAGEAIRSFVAGKDLADFQGDLLLRSGVERQFEIAGEALRRLEATSPSLTRLIHDFPKILAFRNIIAHGYDVLDPAIVWDVAQRDLPRLLERAQEMLEELGNSGHSPGPIQCGPL